MPYKAYLSNKWVSIKKMIVVLAHKKCQEKNKIKMMKNNQRFSLRKGLLATIRITITTNKTHQEKKLMYII